MWSAGDDRRGDGPVRDRRGVGEQHDRGRAERRETDRHQHDSGDGDRRTEARQRLEEAAEAERDEHGHDPWIGGDQVERPAQVLEPSGHDG
jgi:hypothetical protein